MTNASSHFVDLARRVLRERWAFYPTRAASSGLHEYDGRLPSLSKATLNRRRQEVRAAMAETRAVPPEGLAPQQRFERDLLLAGLDSELFGLQEMRPYERDPMSQQGPLRVTNYLNRNYAPPETRMEAMLAILRGVAGHLESVRDLLQPPLAEPVLRQSIVSYRGVARMYEQDLATFLRAVPRSALTDTLDAARQEAADAVREFVAYLEALLPSAQDDFAIGDALYRRMLAANELVELSLADVEAAGERELARNLERLREAVLRQAQDERPVRDERKGGAQGDRSVREAVHEMETDHPSAEGLLPAVAGMLEELRAFIVERNIVSVASEVRAAVRETPAFMRWAFAAMDLPGSFEQVATEAFYYVTPVEPDWSAEQAEQWLGNFNYPTLRIISAHETYPGHYVHFLRRRTVESDVAKAFGSTAFSEGWAHYCEEMMLDAGYGDGDPRLQIAQALEALVRVCRLLCSIRMHTQGMSLDEATAFFRENAFMEELPARKEAERGTFDPGYLNYTLGKLMIFKLRDDWRREQGAAYSLHSFHDALIGVGSPPLPLARRRLLQADDGVVL